MHQGVTIISSDVRVTWRGEHIPAVPTRRQVPRHRSAECPVNLTALDLFEHLSKVDTLFKLGAVGIH
jgi:hypothetical protein